MNERMDAGFPQVSIGFVLIIIGGWLISNGLKNGANWYVFVGGGLLIAVGFFFIYAGCYSQDKANRR